MRLAVEADDGLSPKARRSRELLIGAARTAFARDGFLDARISDIATEAGVAHGTFDTYLDSKDTYLDSKEAVFRRVMIRLFDELREDPAVSPYHLDEPLVRIEHANRRFIDVYRENARLIATVDQVVAFSDDIRALHRELRNRWVQRNIRSIQRWQAAGIADPDLDSEYAAVALQAMVNRFAYVWVVLGYDFNEERAVRTLTRMSAQVLGMQAPPSTVVSPKKAGRRKAASKG